MKLMIKPKYQYILLPLHYGLIAFTSIVNYLQMKRYRQAFIIGVLLIVISIVVDLIVFEILVENFNITLCGISLITIYTEITNIVIDYLLIRNQKKNLKFN